MMRILVPILALIIGLAVALSFALRNPAPPPTVPVPSTTQQATTDDESAPPDAPTTTTQAIDDASTDDDTDAAIAPPPDVDAAEVAIDVQPIAGLHALAPAADAESRHVSIGSDDPSDDNPYTMKVDLVRFGAGYQQITLAKYSARVDADDRYVIAPALDDPDSDQPWRYPLAAHYITINGSSPVLLAVAPWTLTDSGPGAAQYELTIADDADTPVLRIVRRFELDPGSYDLKLSQRFENLTDKPLRVTMRQWLQGDIDLPLGDYLGERQRQIVTGYVRPEYDPGTVFDKGAIRLRTSVLDKTKVWPYNDNGWTLAWLASENRYFALVTHPQLPPDAQSLAAAPYLDQQFASFAIDANVPGKDAKVAILAATTPAMSIAPGGSTSVDLGLFAGPRERSVFASPDLKPLQLGPLVRYEMSSMCSFCTFQWLAKFLLWFLETIHAAVFDWGVAIIILVLVVRLLLHPITKKAQVNMMTMGKKMQLLQPEIEKLKKKYKDDQTKLNTEMMRLYREKGFNPAGFVGGCLPMFLQMPIWVALYAMLYFAIELRQEPAFYGIFQLVSGGNWHFLQDLSQPDNFLRFVPIGQNALEIPFPFIDLHISGINILPILMAVVFYFQQKLTTPPPANEQAAQQQKIMKFMVLLFPIFLYPAPSGLTLYILASTSAGILDSYFVRKHVREQEEAGTLFDKKPVKPGGFRDRLMKKLEEKQAEMAREQKNKGKYKKRP